MTTIFALSTAAVKSGVAIIRISGKKSAACLKLLTKKELPPPRIATLTNLIDPDDNSIIDEALVLWFKAPNSFTGQDTAELHIHGSMAVISQIYEILSNIEDVELAQPGQFSQTAFLNGKMDLTEAEGLADLIDAETKMQARFALRQKRGDLGRLYESWRSKLLSIMSHVEAYIDFPEEEIPEDIIDSIEDDVAKLKQTISIHLNDNNKGQKLRNGLQAVIMGSPNAGKSSLMNILAKKDVAIVSNIPGTTRDLIEVHLDLGGYPLTLIDTAGLRDSIDEIESQGIKRAKDIAASADVKIVILPSNEAMADDIMEQIDENTIVVINKSDLADAKPGDIKDITPLIISVKLGQGIEKLVAELTSRSENFFQQMSDPFITRQRHRNLLKHTMNNLDNFSLDKEIELASEDLRLAAVCLGKITGKIEVEEILGEIFSSFCIGK